MNSEEFRCVFCKESFDDKETLQIHFRKHGDKNFHQNKGRLQDEPGASPDKPVSNKEQAELVECDVCTEVFTSISKAITHKHKVHPDHDAKYFCPWCGKLFTMKHLYNKHISSSHLNEEKIDDQYFHCDCCNVDFNVPAAISYHNKFFHRIYELPTIGNSKKLKIICEEAVQIYYCPFCGEEYDNKVNLHKHMGDEHIDENQNPDEVLRCPVCDAIFYHLDAYELHLTYHSVDDMYTERSEIMDDVTDFSLDTVPPIAEKVENLEFQGDDDKVMGIEQLFELTMDGKKHKKKKHKKHKKSKKEAITMDQFLNMNKDVFGEGIDFQGVEEVPSQIVARRLKKPIKRPAQTTKLPPNIEQLKRQGIVIKKKIGTTSVKPLVGKINVKPTMKPAKAINTNANSVPTKSNTSDTSDDVLAKLINQNNSQIKIVKKSNVESNNRIEEKQDAKSPVVDEVPFEVKKLSSPESSPIPKDSDSVTDENKINDAEIDNTYPNNTVRKSPNPVKIGRQNDDEEESNHSQSILNENEEAVSPRSESNNALRNNSNGAIGSNLSVLDADENKGKVASQGETDTDADADMENNKKDSLLALKKLSHLIVKSVTQETKPTTNETENTPVKEKEIVQTNVSKIAHLLKNKPKSNETNNQAKNEVGQIEVGHLLRSTPTSNEPESQSANDVDKIGHLIRSKPTSNDHDITLTKDKVVSTDVDKIAHLIRNKPTLNEFDNTLVKEKEVVHSDVDKIAHLIRSKQTSNEIDNKEKTASQTEVSKIAHLIQNRPAKVTNTGKTPNVIALPYKTDEIETDENNFDTDDEVNEDNDPTNAEPSQTGKLASILNSPHLNVQTIKKTPIALPAKEATDECLPKNEKSSTDLLKHLKNVTAKPVGVNRLVNIVTTSSPKLSPKLLNSIKKEPVTPPIRHSKIIQEDIEIFNIDDSDSDEATSNCVQKKSDINETPYKTSINETPNKSVDVLKNINKNITIKSVNNNANSTNKGNSKGPANALLKGFDSDCDDEDFDQNGIHPLSPHNSPETFHSPPVNQKQSALNNVLKNLSKNITVKSGNASSQFAMLQDKNLTGHKNDDDDAGSDTNSLPGRVKITEMDDESDDEDRPDSGDSALQDHVKVQYPDDSNSDHDEGNDDDQFDEHWSDEDIETRINASTLKKDNNHSRPNSNLDSLKKLNKDMVIKPSGQSNKPSTSDEIPAFAKSLSNQISIKNMKQSDNCNTQIKTSNSNSKNMEQTAARSVNKSSINQKMSSNVVNKEVKTVKTFQTQTKTVIQEITTTVTKTIKTVNQSMKHEVRNTGQSMAKNIQQLNASNQNFQGIKIRQTSPMAGPRVRNPGIVHNRPTFATPIRPSNQMVLARPRFNAPRQNTPRMPNVRPSTSGPQRPQIGTQIKIAPGIVTTGKRQNTEAPGHFSCFKKPKESLIPEVDFSAMNKDDGESSVQFSSAMQMSKANFACTTKTVKGNSVVTSTQMKSESSASSQQLNKLRNMSGLSIMKRNQTNQSQVEEKSEVSASKRNTLEAIQKLQSQGLLVKKPRLESEESDHSDPGSDHMEHYSDEELGS